MTERGSGDRESPLNGALLRVLGGVLLGIGIGPVVAAVLLAPVEFMLGDVFATLFRPAVHLLAAVFGLVALHSVRLFYPGDWRTPQDGRRGRRS